MNGLTEILSSTIYSKQNILLFNHIFNLDFFKLLNQSLFSYDNNLYYIKKNEYYYGSDTESDDETPELYIDDEARPNDHDDDHDDDERRMVDVYKFLKKPHNTILSITYNIDTTLNVEKQEMFLDTPAPNNKKTSYIVNIP